MLNAYMPLRLIWIFALFGTCASVCDRLKPYMSVHVFVVLLVLPVVTTLIGEWIEEENTDHLFASSSSKLKDKRLGLWIQLASSVLYIFYIVAGIYWMDPVYKPSDRLLFSILDAFGLIPGVLLVVDCYLGLFKDRRITTDLAPSVNQGAMILIAAAFTGFSVFMAVAKDAADLMPYTCLLFFGGCLAIGGTMWWTNFQLKRPVYRLNPQTGSFFRPVDIGTLLFGIAGLLLAWKGIFVPCDKPLTISVGVVFGLWGILISWQRVRMWKGDVATFVATKEGVVTLHKSGWLLYPWQLIAGIDVFTGPGNIPTLGVEFVMPPTHVMISGKAPNASDEEFEKFKENQIKRAEKNSVFTGYHLTIHPIFCRYGIVDLYRKMQSIFVENFAVEAQSQDDLEKDSAENSSGVQPEYPTDPEALKFLPSIKDYKHQGGDTFKERI